MGERIDRLADVLANVGNAPDMARELVYSAAAFMEMRLAARALALDADALAAAFADGRAYERELAAGVATVRQLRPAVPPARQPVIITAVR